MTIIRSVIIIITVVVVGWHRVNWVGFSVAPSSLPGRHTPRTRHRTGMPRSRSSWNRRRSSACFVYITQSSSSTGSGLPVVRNARPVKPVRPENARSSTASGKPSGVLKHFRPFNRAKFVFFCFPEAVTPRRVWPATTDGTATRNVRIIFQILFVVSTAFLPTNTHNRYAVHGRTCECTTSASTSVRLKVDPNS